MRTGLRTDGGMLHRYRACIGGALLLLASTTNAATITVTSTADDGVGCTLRNAVASANSASSVGGCAAGTTGSNTIQLGNATYSVNASGNRPINLINSGGTGGNAIVIQGSTFATIDAANTGRIFDNDSANPVETAISITLRNLEIFGGNADTGGGMYVADNATATLDSVLFIGNNGAFGGGALETAGTVSIINSSFRQNTTTYGLESLLGEGGAILADAGTLTIANSSFSGNQAADGGAICANGATIDISNSSFLDNTADWTGGAISSAYAGPISLRHVTIARNSVIRSSTGTGGGGIYQASPDAFNIDRSIIAKNTAPVGPDCLADSADGYTFTSRDYNVIGNTTGCVMTGPTTNNFVGDPLLSNVLIGLTEAIGLAPYSPARDRAPSGDATDQFGNARPQGLAFDIGALEAAPTVPMMPTIGTITAGVGQATVSFTPSANNGGEPITGYVAQAFQAGPPFVFVTASCDAPCTSVVIPGLTGDLSYVFSVWAVNAVGASVASRGSIAVTVLGVPGAPVIGTASPGNAQATVSFAAPANNGGSAITGYTATSAPGGFSASCNGAACGPIVVGGLANGTAYTFTVIATNAIGSSVPSAASNSVTPATVPGAPTIGVATPGNGQASVTFTAPASDGGSAIASYTATASPGGAAGTCSAPCTSIAVTGLTNGTLYTFTVSATNALGMGASSAASNAVQPQGPPGPPIIAGATVANAQASVAFIAPTSDGGSPITLYTATSSPGALTGTCAAPCNFIFVAGLTYGTAYTFTVAATNGFGTGPASAASNSVTAVSVPGAPTIGTATPGNAQASVTFAPPASNGGSVITSYTATSSPGGFTGACSAPCTSITVGGLVNGSQYVFTVIAINAVGASPSSAPSNIVTPATVPGAPAIGSATGGNAQATITFAAPANDGGSSITSYTATSSPGGLAGTCRGSCTSITVGGLTNGTAYTFTVTAANAVGSGPASSASNSVTPASVPGAPVIGVATPGDAQATVAFTAPASNGGSPITSYTATSAPGLRSGICSAPCTSIVVAGLTNGTAYTFTVTATNALGTGAPSAPSNSATPVTVPGAPSNAGATRGDAQATVAFLAPASNGGSPIISYTATSSPGGFTGSCAAPCTSITVGGLANGTTYTFTVVATNAVGNGPPSNPSNIVTPSTLPGAPTIGTATRGNAQATVTFTAPASNGGATITTYTATSSPGAITGTCALSCNSITVGGLTNGTAYTFTVTATNAAGTGLPSAASNSVTPASVPGAPGIGTATPVGSLAVVTFTPPASDGGSPITSFRATASPGGAIGTCDVPCNTIPVGGLTLGTAYTFTVSAVNALGAGPASAASNSVTPATVPGAPVIGLAAAGNSQATIAFTESASDGGAAISAYTATSSPGAFTGTCAAPCASIIVAGLANGTAYTFRVRATNAVGTAPASAASNSVTPEAGDLFDLNGDGNADLVFEHADGSVEVRLMQGTAVIGSATFVPSAPGRIVTTTGDFNGDGKSDLLYARDDGAVEMWLMDGTVRTSITTIMPAGAGWSVSHVADFNGDGKSDILWRNANGAVGLWLMDGSAVSSRVSLMAAGSPWTAEVVGDFDGDGNADIVWYSADGSVSMWLMNGTMIADRGPLLGAGNPYVPIEVGDFNGDRKSDLLLQSTDGSVQLWLMDGRTATSKTTIMGANANWTVTQVGDFNGDGMSDVVWSARDGTVGIWLMSGSAAVEKKTEMAAGSGWSVSIAGDLSGDANSDVVWSHSSGAVSAWLMNGTSISSRAPLEAAGSTNRIVPVQFHH